VSDEQPDFTGYLSRHYAHLGDQARHRAGKKRQLLATYRRLLPADRTAEMLEIGPGYGQLLELLRRDLGFERTVAIDLSAEVVEFCNAAMPGSTTLVTDTLAHLERNPGRFERVFALHVLEHVPRSAVRDLVCGVGALRPGGRFVVELPNMANVFTGGFLRYADFTHESGYTETSLRHLLESAGLADVECFEERVALDGPKHLLAATFRGAARLVQRTIYRGYELPVPAVLTPALCASAARPVEAP
jgi:SAM-dependent methyltransferase